MSHGKLKNKVCCLTDMGTWFQYARGRSRHAKLASCIYLGLLLWFSAGTGLETELPVHTKWKCLLEPSLFSACPMSFVSGLVGGDGLVLVWMAPLLWKYWDKVLEGGPSKPKKVSGDDDLRNFTTKRKLRRNLNLWIPGHRRHFITQGIFFVTQERFEN